MNRIWNTDGEAKNVHDPSCALWLSPDPAVGCDCNTRHESTAARLDAINPIPADLGDAS